jgi:hypothetical protein
VPVGPGKYEDLCAYVREKADADVAVVIILGGIKGSGFETAGTAEAFARLHAVLPRLLRETADQIEASLASGTN